MTLLGKTAYGIDAGADRIVVKAVLSGGHIRYSRVNENDRDAAEALGMKGLAAASVNGRECFTRWLEFPAVSPRNAGKVLPTVLDLQIPFPVEDCMCCFPEIAVSDAKQGRALAVVARKVDLDNCIKSFSMKGVDPAVIDHEGLALWTQSLAELPPSASDLRIVIYAGPDRMVAVMGKGSEYSTTNYSKPGDADAFARIIMSGIDSIRTKASQDVRDGMVLCLCGPMASDKAIQSIVMTAFPDSPPVMRIHSEPAMFLARSLARRALQDDGYQCNLRTGEYEHPGMSARKRARLSSKAAAVSVAGVFMLVIGIAAVMNMKSRLNAVDTAFAESVRSVAGDIKGQKGEQAIAVANRMLDSRLSALKHFTPGPGRIWTLSQGLIKACAANGISLDNYSMADDFVKLSGSAVSRSSLDKIDALLREYGYTPNINIQAGAAASGLRFSVTAQGQVSK